MRAPVATGEGEPIESMEMKPTWFAPDQLPFEQMWQDAPHWLPAVLARKRIQRQFTFEADNETVQAVQEDK